VALCEELGHELEEVTMPLHEPELMMNAFATLYAAGVATLVADWAALTGRATDKDAFEPLTWALAELGRLRTSADYLESLLRLQREARHVAKLFDTWDLVLCPTLAEPPARLGTFMATADNPYAGFMRAGVYTPFTPLANITGQPSMSVPLFWNEAGLPIGVMFTGRFGAEGTLFRFAAELEQARPWADKAPSIAPR
jgi:Asp-tRNA(Asn)/Glu-tRNA(Gln) amidotransferase A subunit family amidase